MTDCARLLAVLQDGKYHSHSELYGLGMIVHSRVADLRDKGHTIVCTKERTHFDQGRPRFQYFYRLLSSGEPGEPRTADAVLADPRGGGSSPELSGRSVGDQAVSSSAASSSSGELEQTAALTLDTYGVDLAVSELNGEFPGMLQPHGPEPENPFPSGDGRDREAEPLSLDENRRRLAELQISLWGEAA